MNPRRLFLIILFLFSPASAFTATLGLPVGTKAPSSLGSDIASGKLELGTVLKNARGLWILFWRTPTCTMCRGELIEAQRFYSRVKKMGGEFIAISATDVEATRQIKKELMLTFPMVADPKLEVLKSFGVLNHDGLSRPATYVIRKDGTVTYAFVGLSNSDRASFPKVMDALKEALGHDAKND